MTHCRTPFALALLAAGLVGCQTVGPTPELETITQAHRDLADRAEAAIRLAGNTPGREYANRLRLASYVETLKQFRGEVDAPKGSLDWPVNDVTRLSKWSEQGPDWPMPQKVDVPHAKGPVTLDGTLNEPAWTGAATFTNIYKFNDPVARAEPATTWKLLWDDTHLYFAFDCSDRDIVAPRRDRDGDVFADDSVEIFLLPEFRFRTYWELVISPGGDVFDSVECKKIDEWGLSMDPAQTIKGLEFGIDVRGTLNNTNDTDQGYTVEIAVPFDQLPGYSRTTAAAGQTIHFMLVRLDRTDGRFTPYAYQPLMAWGHNIWNHALMELVK